MKSEGGASKDATRWNRVYFAVAVQAVAVIVALWIFSNTFS